MNILISLTSFIIFIYLYVIMATYFIHRKFNYLQETTIAILVGFIVGINIFFFSDFFQSQSEGSQEQIRDIIFLLLLPPIMFEDGYNFPKRKFVQNIFYVNLFGLAGTIFYFLFIWGGLTLFNNLRLFVSISDVNEVIILQNWQILLMSSAFCSIQPLVTEKVVDKSRYPKLFSIMLGESLFKDTISITLFDTIRQMVVNSNSDTYDIQGDDIPFLILKFLEVVVCSILIGFIVGIITTVVFKNLRFLIKQQGISQMAITILTGYIAYLISESLQFSGVISMLFCGTILSHYNIYNLTEAGSSSTRIAIDVLKMVATGVIFFFIGFEVFNVQSFQSAIDSTEKASLSLALLGLSFLLLLVGRVINVYLMALVGYLFVGKQKWKLNVYEYFVIYLMGLIHGAVPFALSVTIPFISLPSSNCSQLNIILVVVVSSVIFTIFLPKLIRIMLTKIRELQVNDRDHPSVKDSFIENIETLKLDSRRSLLDEKKVKMPFFKKLKSTTQKYWKKMENGFLKPHLIYNYHERKDQIKLDKMKKRKEEHDKYLQKFVVLKENILNADNEDANKFYQVVYSDHNSDSDDEDQEKIVIKPSKEDPKSPNDSSKKKETEITTLNLHAKPKQPKNAKSNPAQSQKSESQAQNLALLKKESNKIGDFVLTIEQK